MYKEADKYDFCSNIWEAQMVEWIVFRKVRESFSKVYEQKFIEIS